MKNDVQIFILGAGKGTRMRSDLPKVMHSVAGKSMLQHLLETITTAGFTDIHVIVSSDLKKNTSFVELESNFKFQTHQQKERLGTAHALLAGIGKNLQKTSTPALVLCADTPLLKYSTLENLYKKFAENSNGITCVAFNAKNPKGYGRIIADEDFVLDIIEEKEASHAQKEISLCNAGIYLFSPTALKKILPTIENKNTAGEYYLTDAIKIANRIGMECTYILATETEVSGINDKEQLAAAEKIAQNRLRSQLMKEGTELLDPKTTYFSSDIKIGKNVVIHQNVIFGKNVIIEDDVTILPFCHIDGCIIKKGASIGPFARIRPKSEIGEDAKIGNFVEIKASTLGKNSKASHLSYIGDAKIGSDTNIGAGTIFCNYDGFAKHKTTIGKNVFIGSNSSLIAPIDIEDNAIIGAGSTITEDVTKNALSIARARQVNYQQKAEIVRLKRSK